MSNHPPTTLLIDGTGLLCVALLLRLRRHITAAPAGTLVHVIATDPAASLDLPAWCHLTGHHYLGRLPRHRPTHLRPAHSRQALPHQPQKPLAQDQASRTHRGRPGQQLVFAPDGSAACCAKFAAGGRPKFPASRHLMRGRAAPDCSRRDAGPTPAQLLPGPAAVSFWFSCAARSAVLY